MPKSILYLLIALFIPYSWAGAQSSCVTADCHQTFEDRKTTHPAEFTCDDCHQGDLQDHIEEQTSLSLAGDMCGVCHQDLIRHEYPHPPAAEEACNLCHNPHADLERKLLPKNYPAGFYEDYRKDSYKLCFSCHKRIILRFPDTTYATGFRDGNRNLHYVHVNKDHRGRTCKLCHTVHGGENPKLIARTIEFGEWDMPMHYVKTENGGRCAPGCHRPLSYSRTDK